jgi:DNA-binding MarR family transcriptional regulator
LSKKQIGIKEVKAACNYILQQNESIFMQYRQLLTAAQWNFLIAMAKEGVVIQPTANQFLTKYALGTSATVKRHIKSLSDKELLLIEVDLDKISYRVYDVFLMRWLQSRY